MPDFYTALSAEQECDGSFVSDLTFYMQRPMLYPVFTGCLICLLSKFEINVNINPWGFSCLTQGDVQGLF